MKTDDILFYAAKGKECVCGISLYSHKHHRGNLRGLSLIVEGGETTLLVGGTTKKEDWEKDFDKKFFCLWKGEVGDTPTSVQENVKEFVRHQIALAEKRGREEERERIRGKMTNLLYEMEAEATPDRIYELTLKIVDSLSQEKKD
jgi:hypothetical protein